MRDIGSNLFYQSITFNIMIQASFFSIKKNKVIRWRNLRSKIYHLRARKQWLSWELNMWKISYLVSLDIFCFCAWSKMEHNILIREIKYANLVRKRHSIFSFHFRFLCDETKFYLQLSFIPFDKWNWISMSL